MFKTRELDAKVEQVMEELHAKHNKRFKNIERDFWILRSCKRFGIGAQNIVVINWTLVG